MVRSVSVRSTRSSLGLASLLLLVLALTGCPRTPNAPDPIMGTPCEDNADCNPGENCGALTLCVDGLCEVGNTLVVPCPGEGAPVRPPDP